MSVTGTGGSGASASTTSAGAASPAGGGRVSRGNARGGHSSSLASDMIVVREMNAQERNLLPSGCSALLCYALGWWVAARQQLHEEILD